MSHTEPHDEFLELCAVSTAGQLTQEERKKLDEHLAVCSTCREAIKQYKSLASEVLPGIAADEISGEIDPGPAWSQERAETTLFDRIGQEEHLARISEKRKHDRTWKGTRDAVPFMSGSTWRNVWILYAAVVLLAVSLGICLYQVGMRRGVEVAKDLPPSSTQQNPALLEAQLSDVSHERQAALGQVAERDQEIAGLRKRLEEQAASIARIRAAQDQLAAQHQTDSAARQDSDQRAAEIKKELEAGEANGQILQQKLDVLSRQNSEQQARATQLTSQVDELTQALRGREADLDERDELLAKDRDIRELMGARDLYVAEVYDVNRKGKTEEPYGRVFFTKGKSLIFYAYDLDREPDIKAASTFQAWGQKGPDRQKALNLGIFYVDNAAKKRWILKLDDPNTLAQIDSVFVTVEPHGGSRKPSGTPLLFAYLKADPNHR